MAARHKDLRKAAKLARKLGWTIDNKHGHEFWSPPGGDVKVTVSSSPSDRNAAHAAKRDLRKAGLPI